MDVSDLPIDGQQLQTLLDARVAQLALVLLIILVLLIVPVLIVLLRNARNSEKERNRILESSNQLAADDRKQAALDRQASNEMASRMVTFAETSLKRESELTSAVNQIADINERLPEMYQKSNEGYQKRVLKNHEAIIQTVTGVGEAMDTVTKKTDLDKALSISMQHSDDHHDVVVGKLDDIHQVVVSLKPYGEVIYRLVDTSNAIKMVIEQFTMKMNSDKDFTIQQQVFWTELKGVLLSRVDTMEADIEKLKPARPDSKPIPPLPPLINLPTLLDPTTAPDTSGVKG